MLGTERRCEAADQRQTDPPPHHFPPPTTNQIRNSFPLLYCTYVTTRGKGIISTADTVSLPLRAQNQEMVLSMPSCMHKTVVPTNIVENYPLNDPDWLLQHAQPPKLGHKIPHQTLSENFRENNHRLDVVGVVKSLYSHEP